MNTNNQNGRNISLFIGVYFIIKSVLNMILGGSFGNIIYSIIEAVALYTGLQYINYVVAGITALVVILNLKNNITNIGSNWIYLIEAVIDIGCCVLLVAVSDVKQHFSNKWSEIGKK